MKPCAVTIVGAGLAGSLLGLLLARRGFTPALYERRPDMRRERIAAGRSINLALAARGIHALEKAGVMDVVRPLLIPMTGRRVHSQDGGATLLPYGQNEREVIYSVSRGDLNRLLMTEFERHSGRQIQFGNNIRDPDQLDDAPLFAADGASSTVRASLSAAGVVRTREEPLSHLYKELSIPPGPDGKHRIDRNALHLWPRGGFMLIALPNLDGSFTATLFLPAGGAESFETLTTPEAVDAFFKHHFPSAHALIPDLTDLFFANPTGAMVTVHCTPWHAAPRTVLLGDAAHAIVPFHGQGMNCAFEDCAVMDDLMDRHDDWEALFTEFQTQRKPNTDAIAEMALENYLEMRDSVRARKFQLQKQLSLELERRFPTRFIPRYSMVMFHPEIPYAEAQHRGAAQQRILDDLTAHTDRLEDIDWNRARQLLWT